MNEVNILSNPNVTPQQLVYKGTVYKLGVQTVMLLEDSLGIAKDGGFVTNFVLLNPQGGIGKKSITESLKTHAFIVGGYNFLVDDIANTSQISNNLSLMNFSLDLNIKKDALFSSDDISNLQNNPNLLNVDIPFVWTNTTAMVLPVQSNALYPVSYTLTFKIIDAIPYDFLNKYLLKNQIPKKY